jgi:DNA-binding transcriptional regulator YiaG
MKGLKERLERIEVEEPVHIPNLDGTGIAETIQVKVPAWRDPKDGEVYLDAEATAILDKVKARHMGLLLPEQIKALRKGLGLTQPQISELLQIGEKTWTRWETGRERPSRSINVLLFALNDGKLDATYLRSVARRQNDRASRLAEGAFAARKPWLNTVQEAGK